MTKTPCAIWKTPAEHLNNTGDGAIFDSPRAGGRYWISGTAMDLFPSATDQTKLRLTTWLCEQRRAGIAVPKVDSDSLGLVGSRRSLTVTDRIAAALSFLGRNLTRLSDYLQLGADDDPPKARTDGSGE
jgi:hypothetical protein